jgi:hypothetical protein
MNKQSNSIVDIEEIADKAQRGEDVSAYFTGHHIAKQRISLEFPLQLLRMIGAECELLNIPRDAWIKMVCYERVRQTQAHQASLKSVVTP